VVGDVKLKGLAEGIPAAGAYYTPIAQTPGQARTLTFAIRTTVPPASIVRTLRSHIAMLDPGLPLFDVQTLREHVDRSLSGRRTTMLLSMAFGGVALFLAALGIYGVLAYLVTQRKREIGLRLALGSTRRAVMALIVREGAILVTCGLTLGVGGALGLRQILESRLYGVHATDPAIILAVVLTLSAVSAVAAVWPAYGASRVPPGLILSE
jgi:ABC-type lipoprotein release transport system permease subunit